MASIPTSPPSHPSIFPSQALRTMLVEQFSGRLTITDPKDSSISWRAYLGNGQVHYANSLDGMEHRLAYLCQRHQLPISVDPQILSNYSNEYDYLCAQWQQHACSLTELRRFLFLASQEALVQFLALPRSKVKLEKVVGLDPLVLSIPLKRVVAPVKLQITSWVQLRPEIGSPLQRLEVPNREQFLDQLQRLPVQPHQFFYDPQQFLGPDWQGQTLYQWASHLQTDTLSLAQFLQPLVRLGSVKVSPFARPRVDQRPIIACIDDSKVVQRNVRLILESSGYRILSVTNPEEAVGSLNQRPPVLIFLDISMPEMDGYELCRLLRHQDRLKTVPVVMLTGRDGLLDRIKARMVGATDYLTKPFNPQDLLTIVEKLVSPSQLEVG